QQTAEIRLPHLMRTHATWRGVSLEPLFEEVDISPWLLGLDWMIAGGLSGKHDKAKRALIGAGVGALAGAAVGSYLDKQKNDLDAQLAGSGIGVERKGDSIVLNLPEAITFDSGQAALKPAAEPQIDRIAAVLKEYPQTVVDIAGHTDSTGAAEANQALSQKRAGAVALRFVKAGLPYARMVVSGYGATRPVADNASEAGRAQNRRVEITLLPVTQG
ncbi:MAG TPA: DUF5131 family protein, partial [Plasticicumulans sp.]|nr:DUF5131 family protein [Plasticicumulans sp.]